MDNTTDQRIATININDINKIPHEEFYDILDIIEDRIYKSSL